MTDDRRTVAIRLPRAMVDVLDDAAHTNTVSRSKLIELILDNWLNTQLTTERPPMTALNHHHPLNRAAEELTEARITLNRVVDNLDGELDGQALAELRSRLNLAANELLVAGQDLAQRVDPDPRKRATHILAVELDEVTEANRLLDLLDNAGVELLNAGDALHVLGELNDTKGALNEALDTIRHLEAQRDDALGTFVGNLTHKPHIEALLHELTTPYTSTGQPWPAAAFDKLGEVAAAYDLMRNAPHNTPQRKTARAALSVELAQLGALLVRWSAANAEAGR